MIRRVLIVLLLLASRAHAQDTLSAGRQILTDAERVLGDAARFGSAPARFSGDDLVLAGAFVGGTALLLAADHSAREIALKNQSTAGNDIADVAEKYGEARYGVALSAGLYAGGLLTRSRSARETGILLFESIAFAGATTTIIKSLVGRARPYKDEGNLFFRPFQIDNDYLSFPSGHSTVAFAVSSVLAERIGNPGATIGLYSLAGLTALSRIYNDEHWLSDVTAAAIIGTVSGLAVCRYHAESNEGITVRLLPRPGGVTAAIFF